MKYCVCYNPLSDNKKGLANAEKLREFYPNDELEFVDVTQTTFQHIFDDTLCDAFIIVGGDGTLNHFINDVDCDAIAKDVYYYAGGSGNDFLTDIGGKKGDAPILLNPYIVNLPTIKVNNLTRKFINGIGYGIDGYCCEVADKIRAKDSNKKINYTSIAIKGLLFHYKPTFATVICDGETRTYKKTWLSPCMNGRYFGGGMMAAPGQDRLGDGRLSVMTMHGKGRLATLILFPTIFKGEHVKKSCVDVRKGREITVKFDRPVALQIDGETVLDVREFTATSAKR